MKRRHNLHLGSDVSKQLEELARASGLNKSAVIDDALRAYLRNRGANEIDVLLKPRLDRISSQVDRIRRDLQVTIETLALFIQRDFILTAQHSEDDPAIRAVGQERFESFIHSVAQRITTGRSFVRTVESPPLHEEAAE